MALYVTIYVTIQPSTTQSNLFLKQALICFEAFFCTINTITILKINFSLQTEILKIVTLAKVIVYIWSDSNPSIGLSEGYYYVYPCTGHALTESVTEVLSSEHEVIYCLKKFKVQYFYL